MNEQKRDFNFKSLINDTENVINQLGGGILNLNERVRNLEKMTYQILKYIEEKENG